MPFLSRRISVAKWHLNLVVFIGFWVGFVTGTIVTLKGIDTVMADTSGSDFYNWTFASSGDYTLSDNSLIEVTNSSARLKVNNYQSDANTKFLAHFDESSGTVVTDSSGNANNGTLVLPTPTPTTIWTAGKLDGAGNGQGAVQLDALSSYVTVSDSSGYVSLTGNNTIEAWVKFTNNFSTDTHGTRQYLADKGEYQMYFDQETGKLVYQLQPNTTETWSQKGGGELGRSWDTDGKNTITAMAKTSTNLYAGTGSGAGDAEVWKWDAVNSNWSMVGGNLINSSWEDNLYEEVNSMAAYGEDLLVGMGNTDGDADLYYFDFSGNTWTQIGGDSGGSGAGYSWNTGINTVSSIAVSGTRILVGTGSGSGEGDLWMCDMAGVGGCTKTNGWTQIGGDSGGALAGNSWNSGFDQVWSIYLIGTKMMVGLGNTATEAEVWQCDLTAGYNGCTKTTGWTKIGGDGVLGSWNTVYESVNSITSYVDTTGDTILLAALGTTSGAAPAGDAEIWRCNWTDTNSCTNANAWTGTALIDGNTGSGTAPQSWGQAFERVWNIVVDDQVGTDYLYVGLGDSSGDAEVWQCDLASSCTDIAGWTKLGGDGNNSSWNGAYYYVRSMILDGTTLYTGLYSASAGLGELWRYDGSWTRIGGQYKYGGWGYNGLDRVMSMTTRSGKLYAGTGSGTGDSTVWEFDGSNWSLVGGQETKSSWPYNTIETVESLVGYKGDLYAGSGNSTDDGQVWKYNGTIWSQVGGKKSPALATGWQDADNIEAVYSLVSDKDKLYAGLGNSTDDGKIFSYNGSVWTQIAGAKTPSLATGWQDADNIEAVLSQVSDGNFLYAGLGTTADDADVWRYDKTAGTWSQIANAGAASSTNGNWYNVNDIEGVYSMTVYNGDLYAGLGASTGDAKVYKYNGSTWTQVAGVGADSGYGGWAADYELVRTMTTYNGYLYAGLGTGDAEAEIWRFDGTSWTKIGGDSIDNGTWLAGDNLNTVYGLVDYQGKLYTGTGDSSQTETTVWAYGNNLYLESDAAISTPTNWHHYAATYDGTTARMYIDGAIQTNTDSQALTINDSSRTLVIGSSMGGSNQGGGRGFLDASIDELRISNTNRSSFTTAPYPTTAQWIKPQVARLTSGVGDWSAFTIDESLGSAGQAKYQLSSDNGTTWKYYSSGWTTASGAIIAEANTETEINANIASFPVTANGILWRAVLYSSDGADQVTISNARVTGVIDNTAPSDPANFKVRIASPSGELLTGGLANWYNYDDVFISWDDSTDGGSGLEGYYVSFGADDAEPEAVATSSAVTNRYLTSLTSDTYYLRVRAKDIAGNHTGVVPDPVYIYQLDVTAPESPTSVTVSPAGYSSDGNYTFTWPAAGQTGGATDSGGSNVYGYQYKTEDCDTSDGWSATITETTVSLSDIAYQIDANNFCLRAVDTAGNVDTTAKSVYYYYAGDGPSAPLFLEVDDTPKTTNSFAFSWQPPTSHSGDEDDLTYCYVVNTTPSESTCTYTSPGATSLAAGAFATQYGPNTFRVAARNPEELGGAINYGAYAEVTFTAYTSSPGIPLNIDVSDISVKSTSTWRLTVSWNAPTDVGSGISNYQVHRSTDGTTYSLLASTTGTAYVDVGLSQITYYYKVKACDSVENCGEFTSVDSDLPTGKYTSAASITSGPASSSVTTKKATITWTTDRNSDSKVQYGTSAGSYGSTEPSNSTQTTDHSIALTNLSPGTTYYYKAKFTDEDGNTGTSAEKSFTTAAAPTVSDVGPHTIGLTTVTLNFKTNNASKVKIYYGKSSAFGGLKELSVATSAQVHSVILEDLEDGTKYYYKINTVDSESAEYEGTILDFSTLPRPKISNVRIQQVTGTAQPTMLTSWETNTETSSIVTYWEEGNTAGAKDEVNVALVKGAHRIIVRGLFPQTKYMLQVKGRDKAGNEAVSDIQRFTTSTDTRPPAISELSVEGSVSNLQANKEISGQLSVTWNTDEAATSQVEFGEGTGTTYSQKTQEDANLTNNHLVLISGLAPSKVYHLRILSKDKAGNEAKSIDTVTITPKITDSALDLVISNLQQAFGFLGGIGN